MKSNVRITPDILNLMRNLAFQSGATPHRLFSGRELPEGLTINIIELWFDDRTETARPEHLDFVHSTYAAFADEHISTARLRFTLKAEIERTGLTPRRMLLKNTDDQPTGLTATEVDTWTAKRPKPARKDHVDFVLESYKRQPTIKCPKTAIRKRSELLGRERDRTRVSFRAIMRGQDIPGVATPSLERAARGQGHRLSLEQLDMVLALYSAMPDQTRVTAEEGRDALIAERERTGWGAARLFKVYGEPGDDADYRALDRFRSGKQDTVSRIDYESALSHYAKVPNRLNRST